METHRFLSVSNQSIKTKKKEPHKHILRLHEETTCLDTSLLSQQSYNRNHPYHHTLRLGSAIYTPHADTFTSRLRKTSSPLKSPHRFCDQWGKDSPLPEFPFLILRRNVASALFVANTTEKKPSLKRLGNEVSTFLPSNLTEACHSLKAPADPANCWFCSSKAERFWN